MLSLLLPKRAPHGGSSFFAKLAHLGLPGLFVLAIIDSAPLPTFNGPDILLAILAASHHDAWYEYAAAATAGSVLGAYITYRISRKAGEAALSKFGKGKVSRFMKMFNRWGTGTLIAMTAIPFPMPTTMCFAAAGVSGYPLGRYIAVISLSRAARYYAIAFIAEHYGRHFIRVLRHPTQHWGWLLLFAALMAAFIAGSILLKRTFASADDAPHGRKVETQSRATSQ